MVLDFRIRIYIREIDANIDSHGLVHKLTISSNFGSSNELNVSQLQVA